MSTATIGGPVTVQAPERAEGRLLSLDVLRGITMAAMVLVNDPGTGTIYAQLDHAEWNGATFTDMIFPCFLVIVGVSMTLSFAARLGRGASRGRLAVHAVRRGLLIVLIGLLLNWVFTLRLSDLRFPGVLQRIGICYMVSALLYLALPGPDEGRWRRQREVVLGSVAVLLLATYWALLKLYPTPGFGPGRLDTLGSLPAVVDRAVFGVHHVWRAAVTPGMGPTYDPEGVLSTLPAISNVLFGVLAGEVLRSRTSRGRQCGAVATMGAVLWLAGLSLSHWLPLNKKLWTSSFALFSSGIALLCLAGLLYVVDLRRVRRGWGFFLIFGTNAILAYILADVVAWLFDRIRLPDGGRLRGLHWVVYRHLCASWLPPKMASLCFAVIFCGVIAALVWPLYRRRIFLRL